MKMKQEFFWEKIYQWIRKLLALNFDLDEESAILLGNLIANKSVELSYAYTIFEGKSATVVGASKCYKDYDIENSVIVAADKGAKCLIEMGIVPDVIVTDLDGIDLEKIDLYKKVRLFFVHSHGDNISRLQYTVPRLIDSGLKVIGTTQIKPRYPLFNFGGFTDGDRAAFISAFFGSTNIKVYGIGEDYISLESMNISSNASSISNMKFFVGYLLTDWLRCRGTIRVELPKSTKRACIEKYPWEES